MIKSAFVTYDHTKIPPYDGIIGKTVSVPYCRVSLPPAPMVDESPKPVIERIVKSNKRNYAVFLSVSIEYRRNTHFFVPL